MLQQLQQRQPDAREAQERSMQDEQIQEQQQAQEKDDVKEQSKNKTRQRKNHTQPRRRRRRIREFDPDTVGVYHCRNRCVREQFLLSAPLRVMIVDLMKDLAHATAFDILDFALLENHFHLMLRNRPDIGKLWSDDEVLRRWWHLFPGRRTEDGSPAEPTEEEFTAWSRDQAPVVDLRKRLCDLSWFMKIFSERIARRANAEAGTQGHFFAHRFKSTRLLDRAAILACSLYINLNLIRAGIATTPEESTFTSAYLRIVARWQQIQQMLHGSVPTGFVESIFESVPAECASDAEPAASDEVAPAIEPMQAGTPAAHKFAIRQDQVIAEPTPDQLNPDYVDSFLAPVYLQSLSAEALANDPRPCAGSLMDNSFPAPRVSNKGFLDIPRDWFLQLLDWAGRQVRADKRGVIPAHLAPIFDRLKVEPVTWLKAILSFEKVFPAFAGFGNTLREAATAMNRTYFRGVRAGEAAMVRA